MQTATCIHTFCDRDHHADPADPHVHESRLEQLPAQQKAGARTEVRTMTSYVDGDDQALLYLSAPDLELDADGVDALIAALTRQAAAMRTVRIPAVA